MTILYINAWPLADSLTTASTIPNLKVLSSSKKITKIIFVTPEYYNNKNKAEVNIPKVIHYTMPLYRCENISLLKYFCFEFQARKILKYIIKKHDFNKILARGTSSIGRTLWVHKKTNIPFYIESFEPHAQVMKESGVWSSLDPRYLIQKNWESQCIKKAAGLSVVSNNYAKKLKENIKSQIVVTPCTVDLQTFKFNSSTRIIMRKKLNIKENDLVAIYVGKFGGIYYDDEAFHSFDTAFKNIKDFQLILLSPIKKETLISKLKLFRNIDISRVHHFFVHQSEVPKYLNAADFAYAFIKSKPSTLYCSPIKIAEYWANGLPIVLPKDIGDDSEILENTELGAILDTENIVNIEYLNKILKIIELKDHKIKINDLARKYRNPNLIIEGYKKLSIIEKDYND